MKIDLHCHTKKIKKGEKVTRTIPDDEESYRKFIDKRISEDVKIIAITNHNHFDIEQYNKILKSKNGSEILILPGVEIDVKDSLETSHGCNLITSCSNADELSKYLSTMVNNEETHKIELSEFLEIAKHFKAILLIDSKDKASDFPKDDMKLIRDGTFRNEYFYALEAANGKSASIITNHDIKAIVGSDSDFWDEFVSTKLPEIDTEINDFEGLLSFLKANYYYGLNKTREEKMIFTPKDENGSWETEINFDLKSGVNIIVGPKASGKSVILKNIKEKINEEHSTEILYYGEETKFEEIEKVSKEEMEKNILNLDQHFSNLEICLSQCLDIGFSNIMHDLKNLILYTNSEKHKVYHHLQELVDGEHVWNEAQEHKMNEELGNSELELVKIRDAILILKKHNFNSIYAATINDLEKWIKEFKNLIIRNYLVYIQKKIIKNTKDLFKSEISKKTNNIQKPSQLGLYQYWSTRNNLLISINNIVDTKIKKSDKLFIGDIIDSAGETKNIFLNCESFLYSEENCKNIPDEKSIEIGDKRKIKEILKSFNLLKKNIFECKENQKTITKTIELIRSSNLNGKSLIGKYFFYTRDHDKKQTPSSGEKQFLLLSNILNNEKGNYYFLDEPEKSLDNKIINDYIVDKINSLQNQNKYIIITTHSANIAINSNPKSIIYRHVGEKGNTTFIGDSYSKVLNSPDGQSKLEWPKIALSLLEGGKDALDARRDYYYDKKGKII